MKTFTPTRGRPLFTVGYPMFRLMPIAALGLAAACAKESAARSEAPAHAAAKIDSVPTILATIGDDKITFDDVRARSGSQLDVLDMQYQLAKSKIIRTALDSLLRERTLTTEAKATGKSVDELVAAEAGPGGFDPSNEEIAAWYKNNPTRAGNRPLEQLRSQIASLLRNEKHKLAEEKLQERINAKRKVAITYDVYRLRFNNDKAPTLGKSDAPVTLVEFSDFQCPYCKAAAPALREVERKFGDKLQVIYRQFPLTSIHPFAFKAAEASLCANEQAKFWDMHDTMFENQDKLAVADLKQTARRLGMDGTKFDTCLDAGRYVEQIQTDVKEGQRFGVNGTPAMFINGVYVEGGSVPASVLETLIQKELTRVKSGS